MSTLGLGRWGSHSHFSSEWPEQDLHAGARTGTSRWRGEEPYGFVLNVAVKVLLLPSSCITSLSWLVLFYFYVGHLLLWSEDQTKVDTTVVFLFFSQHITYMSVFCPQGVVYLNGPTRVHDGGVRLCIWTSSFNSMCSVGEKGCGYVWVYFFSVNIPFLYSWWNVYLHQARYWPRCSFQILYF